MDSHWEDLRLTEEEEKIVDCSNTRDESFASRASMALAGKVLTVKPYRVTELFAFLRQVWKVSKPFGIRELGDNLYVFQFFTMKDKNWVLQEGPWLFDRQLILLSEIQANLTPSEINFSYVNFWVRGYDIPFGYVSRSTATALASAFGGLVDYREDDDLGWSKYVAFRVCVDVRQPLLRGAITTFGNGVAKWVPFKYEKLPNFCYRCGRLGHVEEDCKMQEDVDVKGQYGEWMRDSHSPRGLNGKHNSKEIRNWVDGRDKAGAEGETPKTGVRKSLKEILEAANSSIKGNTNDMVVTPNKDNTEATSTMSKLNKEKSSVGTPASVDIVIPPEPSYASFFQALNIPTKINKGAAEIISRVDLIKKGEKVGNSLATLLSKLGIKPFANSLEMEKVDKDGSVYNLVVLDMTEDDLAQRFSSGVANVSALALSISYPAISAVPRMIANGYKNVLAISLETDYTFPLAEQVKEYHKDPSKFAAAVAPVVAADAGTVVSSATAVALMEAIKEESEEEDNMFSLFDE